ncbi:MAG: hypothetical protein H7Y27_13430 [Gemmatimonadaceae bacterium]|nr:hypothetical protein [Chitinophagaceae bacterium]
MVSMFLSLVEVRQLLVVILWISIPLVILSLFIATIWHYRRKRIYSKIELPAEISEEIIAEKSPAVENLYQPSANDADVKRLSAMISQLNLEISLQKQQTESAEKENSKLQSVLKEMQVSAQVAHQDARNAGRDTQDLANDFSRQQHEENEKMNFLYEAARKAIHMQDETERNYSGQIEIFENSISLLTAERDAMQEAMEKAGNRIQYLEEKLSAAEKQAQDYERRWAMNSQLISRIYSELEESRRDPVIIN